MITVKQLADKLDCAKVTVHRAADKLQLGKTAKAAGNRPVRSFTKKEEAELTAYLQRERPGIPLGTVRSKYPRNFHIQISFLAMQAKSQDKTTTLNNTSLREIYDEQDGLCAYTGRTMTMDNGPNQMVLSRLDHTIGFTADNTILIADVVQHPVKHGLNDAALVKLCKEIIGVLDAPQDDP